MKFSDLCLILSHGPPLYIESRIATVLRIYVAAHHYYGHVAAGYTYINLTNCYGITNLLLRKFAFTENQTFLRNFYTTKIWSHTVYRN